MIDGVDDLTRRPLVHLNRAQDMVAYALKSSRGVELVYRKNRRLLDSPLLVDEFAQFGSRVDVHAVFGHLGDGVDCTPGE